jgi:hypothetical protein
MTDTTGALRELVHKLDAAICNNGSVDWQQIAIERIDSYAAERERIARADEREKCAEKATLWVGKWFHTNAEIFIVPAGEVVSLHYGDLAAAIKEDGK